MGDKIKLQERRKFQRIPFHSKIQYKDFYNPLQVFRTATCLDLSVGGAHFQTFEPLEEGQILTLLVDLFLPNTYQSVRAKIFAKVVRRIQQANKRGFVGVHFIAIDRKGAIAIGQVVNRALRSRDKVVSVDQRKLEKAAVGF